MMERVLHQPRSWNSWGKRAVLAPQQHGAARAVLVVLGVLLSGLALVFWFRLPLSSSIWPTPLSNGSFLAAVVASIAVPVLFIAWTGDLSGVRAGAVSLGAIYGGFVLASIPPLLAGAGAFLPFLLVSAIAVVGNVGMFRWAQRFDDHDKRTPPAVVLWMFVVSAILLIIPGVAALLGVDFLPTPLPVETLRLYGAIYVGAGALFLWALARPTWSNARVVLVAFLAYDVARLIVFPQFLPRLLADPAGVRIAAWIYWAAVIVSGVIAAVFLLAAPNWRLWRMRTDQSERGGERSVG
ncbi:MAG: hypothetical protein RMM58_07430 [Chloroflexota bacterium]|nr:hypothetical protein [Dehalococcoidia bacterium]MDW8253691.1 hypothetical protein [Chloroflexota bacterium]